MSAPGTALKLLSTASLLLAPLLANAADTQPPAATAKPFTSTAVAQLNRPWAMSFLPDGSLLISQKGGQLKHLDPATGKLADISGIPAVVDAGQGGFGDVLPHPDFANNGWVYLSYVEAGDGDNHGAVVARAKLQLAADGSGQLADLQVIWRQTPKVTGNGHYGHRLAFGPDGKLWISSSERQKFDPAQDMSVNLGKIIRLNDDGSVPADNPFVDKGGATAQIWSLGHCNILGLAFDAEGRLWEDEMGPMGGDELNLIQRGANYGWPVVSNGNHYDGKPIPDHATRPDFAAPKASWNPVISPSSLVIYSGKQFPQWQGNALIGGLSSKSLVRVQLDGESAHEVARYDMGQRIREVEQGPDGAVWLLEDGEEGRLLRLEPINAG